MNKALLPILARLHSLQVVARVTSEGERVVASRSDPTPITVILREINETILARELHFTSETGSSLTLEIAGRRILRLIAAQGLPGAEACLAAPALGDEHKDDLLKLLLALASPRQEIRVQSSAVKQATEGVSIGLPVALIADLLLVELNGLDAEVISDAVPPPQAPATTTLAATTVEATSTAGIGPLLGRFARANSSVLMAWLILGGEEDGTTDGPEEMVDHLRGFLTDEGSELDAQLSRISQSPAEPVCIALGASLVSGHSIICARAKSGTFLGLAEGNCTIGLMSAWSSALR